jgi:hypothetical protein
MPGKQVKNWDMYHALREEGYSKESAARITNARTRERSKRSRKRANKRNGGKGKAGK